MRIPTLTRSRNRSAPYRQTTGRWLLRAAGVVFMGLIASGSLTLSSSAGHRSEAPMTSLSSSQAAELSNNDDDIKQRIPIMPKFVLTNMASPDPNARLRALDCCYATHTKIPLSHVFEAIEDEDEVMQARAAAIIEQQWAIEEYLIDLTFSMTWSDHSGPITKKP